MALTKVSRGLLSTGIVDNSNAMAITIDSSENIGLGLVPTNFANRTSLDIGLAGKIWGHAAATETGHGSNFYFDGAYKRIAAVAPTRHVQNNDGHTFSVAASGAADSTITWDDALIVSPSGSLLINSSATADTGGIKLFSNSGVNALPATSGTTQTGGALRLRGANNAVLDMGLNSVYTWIQATDKANLANEYYLMLNPNGGSVGINNTIADAFNGGANNLVVGSGSGSEGITIYGGAESNIFFADGTTGTNAYKGRLEYSHGVDHMRFYSNNIHALNINENGQVGVKSRRGFRFGNAELQGNAGSSGGGYPVIGYNLAFTSTGGNYGTLVSDTSWRIDIGDNARLQIHSASSAGPVSSGRAYTAGPYVALNGTTWTGGSDERLKENISVITGADAVARVKAMRPVNYSWIHDSESADQLGFIAQEMLSAVPEVVDVPETETDPITQETLMWGITYDRLIPVLTAALQEALTKIETLEGKVQTLENN